MYILSIDQGTTGSRAVVYDKNGRKVASHYKEFTQYFPKPGWVEHDPEEIWKSVYVCIQEVLKKVNPNSIAAIGITNQRETTIVWDKKTGRSVYNAIVWQCRRTAGRAEELKAEGLSKKIRQKTGLTIDPYFSATKVEWILKQILNPKSQIPNVIASEAKQSHSYNGIASSPSTSFRGPRNDTTKFKTEDLLFGTTDSWILWKLTGGKVHATDYTNASRTMLFNIKTLKWDKDLLKIFNVPETILPQVKSSSGEFGKTIKIGKLQAGIPISGIAGDQQAALFGQTCFEAGELKNTYGTGCFILLNTGKKYLVSNNGLITTLGCDRYGKPAYVLEGSVFIAGAAIQWLRDGLKIISSASESEKIALSLKDNEGVYFVPALVGLGAPYWDSSARGTIVGITRGTDRRHFVRAALEAMCYSTKDVIDLMQKESRLKIKNMKVDGGAVINNFLCQFQADILGVDVVRPKIIETTSLGAAYLAGLAIGYWKNTEEIKKCWAKDREFKPRMKQTEAMRLYKGWKKAVSRTLGRKT